MRNTDLRSRATTLHKRNSRTGTRATRRILGGTDKRFQSCLVKESKSLQSMEACISSAPFLFLQNKSENCGGKRRQAGEFSPPFLLLCCSVFSFHYKAEDEAARSQLLGKELRTQRNKEKIKIRGALLH
jgi:hypothetical protein